jgi:hypothetical protein
MKKPDFNKSMEMFSKWRSEKYEHSNCMFQVINNNVCVEKWLSGSPYGSSKVYIVEIYPDGNGFQIYEMEK